jgi:hypothetical protein
MKDITIVYVAAEINGEPGYSYEVIVNRRIVAGGWSRGKKRHAEEQARADVARLEKKAA